MGDKNNEIIIYNENEIKKSSEGLTEAFGDARKFLLMILLELRKAVGDVGNEIIRLNSNLSNFKDVIESTFLEGSKDIIEWKEESVEALKEGGSEAEKASTSFKDIAKKGADIFDKIISSKAIKNLENFGKESINLASNLQEVQNIIDTAFPNEAESINEWAKNAINAFGMSEVEAKKFNITMADTLKSMGFSSGEAVNMSQGIIGLSGD